MKIYNTLSGSKEEFIPRNGNDVKMYACGITVSGEAHIGHTYQALIYDIIRKFLVKKGYNVTYARNYTDVDDKIIAKSNETGIPADEYAEMMIKKIDEVMAEMEVGEPDIWLKATMNIDNIIDFVSKLIEKGHAYPTKNGDVYFSVESFPAYGRLSHRNLEDALNGVRIDNDEEKRAAQADQIGACFSAELFAVAVQVSHEFLPLLLQLEDHDNPTQIDAHSIVHVESNIW